jgi:isopenicillin N synthase-like dioxygenase
VSAFAVPVVDISPYVRGGSEAERAAVAAAMDEACRTVGFIQVVGRDVPTSVADGLAAAMDSFFAQSLEVQKAWRARRPRSTAAAARPRASRCRCRWAWGRRPG